MSLSIDALEWAIKFVSDHSDGDLFPRIEEMEAILAKKSELAADLLKKPISDLIPGGHRRFIVPKDEISYRQATQLDPQDSIILSAIVYEHGSKIESRRRPCNEVFSYRFRPTQAHGLYGSQSGWNDYWRTADRISESSGCILYCDIADFYNQIYHHTVENQLIESGLPNQDVKWVISLLESTTAGVSRGIPIGPHAAHLLAEATLIPIDNSMKLSGFKFLRYADDIVIFCESHLHAKRALAQLAITLDKQQRLTLQRHKTRFFKPDEFRAYCQSMIDDRPISSNEEKLLTIIKSCSGGNPYRSVLHKDIDGNVISSISGAAIESIIVSYLESESPDYIRLRWFYRRLAQIGHPGAINVTLGNIEYLTPCFAGICTYLASVQSIGSEQWVEIGEKLLALLNHEAVCYNEYFRLMILSIFSRNSHINHFSRLAMMYKGSDPFAKREILLAGKTAGATDWLREFKEDFDSMDHWWKMAFLYCCREMPSDEKKFFINRLNLYRPYDISLAKWAKEKK